MRSQARTLRSLSLLFAAALLSACAGHAGNALPSSGAPFAPVSLVHKRALPPKCKGEKVSKQYATAKVVMTSKGGTVCVPTFGGIGGTISYPPATPNAHVDFTSSVARYTKAIPQLGKGKATFYLQISFLQATSFGTSTPAGGALGGRTIVAGRTYTAFAAATTPYYAKLGACTVVAKKGKYGGSIAGLGSLLKGQVLPLPVNGVVEIYPGSQSSNEC